MKKILHLLIITGLVCCVFNSCKKDNNTDTSTDGAYTIKFKINGEQHTLTSAGANTSTVGQVVPTTYFTSMVGIDSAAPNNIFEVGLYTTTLLKANTTFTSNPNATTNIVGMAYAYNGDGLDASSTGANITLTVTDVTTSSMKGTFSGVLVGTSGTKYTITEGQFYSALGQK